MKSFNKIGIIIAVLFAILLLLVSAKDNATYKLDEKLISVQIQKSEMVNPAEINEWITEKNQVFTLVDIRTEKEFDKGSIPTAENIPAKEILKKEVVSDLPKDMAVIIYSNNLKNNDVKKSFIILKEAGIKAFVLEGGYDYWVKYPVLPKKTISNEEILIYNQQLSIANSLKGIVSADMTGMTPVKKKKSTKKKRKKKKNKLEGC